MTANYDERAKALGRYMAESGATVRVAARAFGMAKSTVHKDVTERLPMLDAALAERHLRGGEATRRKYAAFAPERGH